MFLSCLSVHASVHNKVCGHNTLGTASKNFTKFITCVQSGTKIHLLHCEVKRSNVKVTVKFSGQEIAIDSYHLVTL